MLENYEWPGNVRELENIIQRAVIISTAETIHTNILQSLIPKKYISKRSNNSENVESAIPSILASNKTLAKRAVEACQGNKSKAAKILGISRKKLYELLQ